MTTPTQPDEIIVYQSEHNQQWFWKREAANGQVIAVGGEGYTDQTECADMARALACPRGGVEPTFTVRAAS